VTKSSLATRTTSEPKALIRDLRSTLRAMACPEDAAPMQRYMKSTMPYYGIKTQPLRKAAKQVFDRHPLADFASYRDAVLTLYRTAKRREERYAAIQLSGLKPYAQYQSMKALPMYEEMIVTGAWWDFVDIIASHRLGALLRRHPAAMKKRMRRWARSKDMWKRRSAILCQLGFKHDIDLKLLYDCIEPSLGSSEFFLRKAIGWALRSHAWIDPDEVVRYVRAHEDRLSPLSKREALKNV
jgi:3-methyladenine DNA glycosylase AlkD